MKKRREIVCKRFEELIPAFLEDRLNDAAAEDFLSHFDSCRSCREELSIQYLVYAGLPKLETGETFHLNRELAETITAARERILRRKKLGFCAYSMEILTIVAVGISAALMVFFF
ncbi:zf-HC2 domain-containing protein [Lachnoclostridium sp. Marseille-P6806]|uniref:zf-HC2 domain-containing protein n=1 Tax=Lachnoclostridium sp. Marseille-P6806 TaxID=2364793 RepID=UPI0013EEEB6B|nr:zf-HC2 domain-containing protein [Lachnoclostridium sp. Marseille-P6806]